ncbi:MAG: glycoside hydrolase [Spirochaetaceae bacterium]|nr:MAG: glycoside hydrolase [Spirochaetaceae bacterium]
MTIIGRRNPARTVRCIAAIAALLAFTRCAGAPDSVPTTAEHTAQIGALTVPDDPPQPDAAAEPRTAVAVIEDEPAARAPIDAAAQALAQAVAEAAEAAQKRRRMVDSALAALSLEQLVGQLFMPAFPVDARGRGLLAIDDRVRRMMREIEPGGVLLVGLNVDSTDQVMRLIEDLQQTAALPLLIATDHEGGAVSRISASGRIPATRIPSPHIVGAVADPQLAYRLGEVIGRELRSLGIQVNFAPVADLRTNPHNSVIGDRSFGSDPETVGGIVAQLVRGMQDQHVAAVLKHFPGHGDTIEDSHYEAASVRHDQERLRHVEMVPFRRGIEAGALGVMTAHISVPEVTGNRAPATLSPLLLGPVLRGELGFERLIFSDALNMHALTRYYNRSQVAVLALEAGVDVLVHPERPLEAYQAVLDAVHGGVLSVERVEQSARTILEVKYDLGLLGDTAQPSGVPSLAADLSILGAEQHRAVADEILSRFRQTQSERGGSR